jgi:hypothetical protein
MKKRQQANLNLHDVLLERGKARQQALNLLGAWNTSTKYDVMLFSVYFFYIIDEQKDNHILIHQSVIKEL